MKLLTDAKRETVNRTPNPHCPACQASRQHSAIEFDQFHPDNRHGCVDGRWSKPGMERER